MLFHIPEDLIHVSFFFIDIVGLSDPKMSTGTQTRKIKVLNKLVAECKSFLSTPMDQKLVLPTGDGMAIGFFNQIESPIQLAIELQKKIRQYNFDQTDIDKILVRIGCHNGNVFIVKDLLGNKNFWGPGIILARRVMDIGDAGHILMTSSMAETLLELSDDYGKIIHPIHEYQIKHGENLLLYSVYDNIIGNSEKPKKRVTSTPIYDYTEARKGIRYTNLDLVLNLKNLTTNILEIIQTDKFENISDNPLFEIQIAISTNSEKSLDKLNQTLKDNNNQTLSVKGIVVDTLKKCSQSN